jgi:hypothetical protein
MASSNISEGLFFSFHQYLSEYIEAFGEDL